MRPLFGPTRRLLAAVEGAAAYEALGVRRDAGVKGIKKHFRKLAMRLHPDMNPGLDDSGKQKMAERFAQLALAMKWIEANHQESGLEQVKERARQKAALYAHPQDRRPSVPMTGRPAAAAAAGPTTAASGVSVKAHRQAVEHARSQRAAARDMNTSEMDVRNYQRAPPKVTSAGMPSLPRRRGPAAPSAAAQYLGQAAAQPAPESPPPAQQQFGGVFGQSASAAAAKLGGELSQEDLDRIMTVEDGEEDDEEDAAVAQPTQPRA
eukprot:TRINITY_DN12569_c0_g1_i1.p2 TRINITY_DN12569_c0_g1~~TRINITY_DN12569_c0_g1_i1.p2  ORF type:complete len:299 (+),score=92.01 TRINITY_DN12569_c0_g1_i1:106-897(+)